jgi:nicotinamidase-related amidase
MSGLGVLHNRFADTVVSAAAAVVLIDPQAALFDVMAEVADRVCDNLVGLAQVAEAYGLPVVVTTRCIAGPVVSRLTPLIDADSVITRPELAVFPCPALEAALQALHRRVLFLAGWGLGETLADAALAAQRAGYDVHIVADASWPEEDGAGYRGFARMRAAGVTITTWVALLAGLSAEQAAHELPGPAQLALRESLARYAPAALASWNVEGVLEFDS